MVAVNLTVTIEIRARQVNKQPHYTEISALGHRSPGGHTGGRHLTHRNRERSTHLGWAVSQEIDIRRQVKRGAGRSSRWPGACKGIESVTGAPVHLGQCECLGRQ